MKLAPQSRDILRQYKALINAAAAMPVSGN